MSRKLRLAAAFSTAALVACAARPPLKNVSLQWTPSADASFGAVQASDHKFSFTAFRDVRQRPELIAENREKATPRLVTTKDDVGVFVATHMRQIFDRAGLTTLDSGGDLVITGDVRRFFVEETNTYKASVVLRIAVRTTTGRVLWEGNVSGAASTFGRSYSMENYDQVLSDSIVNATVTLFNDQSFRSAVAQQ
ncbi:MAG: hypothetical protein ACREUT_04215 [Steroidobacteraceae bacterium]